MKPLIKWPGGKRNEFGKIQRHIPPKSEYDRYIEPFFGGGSVFWQLQPEKAIINDKCEVLMDFYRFVGDVSGYDADEFRRAVYQIVSDWEWLSVLVEHIQDDVLEAYERYKWSDISKDVFEVSIERAVSKREDVFDRFEMRNSLMSTIIERLQEKMVRTEEIDIRNDFSADEVIKNIETGVRSGYYTCIRDLYNDHRVTDSVTLSAATEVAIFFFIREFCYGSMFRYNSDGEFNISYGGLSYNGRDIRSKVKRVFSDKTQTVMSESVNIHDGDFESVLETYQLKQTDFVFLDPPYDTSFSTYAGNVFDKSDHRRLANWLERVPAQFVMVIENTDFVRSAYDEGTPFEIESFEKQYEYNVRNRNEQSAEHLVVYSDRNRVSRLNEVMQSEGRQD